MNEEEKDAKLHLAHQYFKNPEEKQFAEEQYQSKCQICNKTIIKKNGTRYCEVINLLRTDKLEKDVLKGLTTGWNSLCLCPNCSAEYRYGSVDLMDIKEKAKNTDIKEHYDDYYYFDIEMQGKKRTLHYTPQHLLALQVAIKKFAQET